MEVGSAHLRETYFNVLINDSNDFYQHLPLILCLVGIYVAFLLGNLKRNQIEDCYQLEENEVCLAQFVLSQIFLWDVAQLCESTFVLLWLLRDVGPEYFQWVLALHCNVEIFDGEGS